jgi:hypothetical protein
MRGTGPAIVLCCLHAAGRGTLWAQSSGTGLAANGLNKKSRRLVGVDTTHFSGIAIRRVGISAALAAGALAPVLYLNSGHGGMMAAQNYMVPLDPRVWCENFAALQM